MSARPGRGLLVAVLACACWVLMLGLVELAIDGHGGIPPLQVGMDGKTLIDPHTPNHMLGSGYHVWNPLSWSSKQNPFSEN